MVVGGKEETIVEIKECCPGFTRNTNQIGCPTGMYNKIKWNYHVLVYICSVNRFQESSTKGWIIKKTKCQYHIHSSLVSLAYDIWWWIQFYKCLSISTVILQNKDTKIYVVICYISTLYFKILNWKNRKCRLSSYHWKRIMPNADKI